MALDSAVHGDFLYTGAVKSGHVDVASQKVSPALGTTTWTTTPALPSGVSACAVNVADHGNVVFVETLSTAGTLYETTCAFATDMTPVSCTTAWSVAVNQPAKTRSSAEPAEPEKLARRELLP